MQSAAGTTASTRYTADTDTPATDLLTLARLWIDSERAKPFGPSHFKTHARQRQSHKTKPTHQRGFQQRTGHAGTARMRHDCQRSSCMLWSETGGAGLLGRRSKATRAMLYLNKYLSRHHHRQSLSGQHRRGGQHAVVGTHLYIYVFDTGKWFRDPVAIGRRMLTRCAMVRQLCAVGVASSSTPGPRHRSRGQESGDPCFFDAFTRDGSWRWDFRTLGKILGCPRKKRKSELNVRGW